MAGSHEKDLSTTQSQTREKAWFFSADGDAGRAQSAQAAARQGTDTPGYFDPGETARLSRQARVLGFSAADRLHRRAEFLRAQRDGLRRQTKHFVIYLWARQSADLSEVGFSTLGSVRLGITVSRRIGNAVARNRVKRRVRELFRRELRKGLPVGSDLVVIARNGAAMLTSDEVRRELADALAWVTHRLGVP